MLLETLDRDVKYEGRRAQHHEGADCITGEVHTGASMEQEMLYFSLEEGEHSNLKSGSMEKVSVHCPSDFSGSSHRLHVLMYAMCTEQCLTLDKGLRYEAIRHFMKQSKPDTE